jgi:hypothetical protein
MNGDNCLNYEKMGIIDNNVMIKILLGKNKLTPFVNVCFIRSIGSILNMDSASVKELYSNYIGDNTSFYSIYNSIEVYKYEKVATAVEWFECEQQVDQWIEDRRNKDIRHIGSRIIQEYIEVIENEIEPTFSSLKWMVQMLLTDASAENLGRNLLYINAYQFDLRHILYRELLFRESEEKEIHYLAIFMHNHSMMSQISLDEVEKAASDSLKTIEEHNTQEEIMQTYADTLLSLFRRICDPLFLRRPIDTRNDI